MDLSFTDDELAFRAEARAWLEANVPDPALPSMDTAEGFEAHRRWERQLFDAGWAVVSWPTEYGGRGASLVEWLIFEEEYYRSGAPGRVSQNGIFLLAPTMFEFGTPDQHGRFLRRMAASDDIWAQGWSEPDAGSDLAGIKSIARRNDTDDGWVLHGQKTWCSRGSFADWLFGLFRSDPEAERHRGLTYYLVPLNAEGVTVRPIGRLDGEPGFAEVFFDGVQVPDRDVLGAVNQGWGVAMATASSERGLSLRSPGRFMATADRLVDLYKRVGSAADPGLGDEVVQAYMDADAYRLYTFQTVGRLLDGGAIGPEASLNKIFWSELDVRMHDIALRLLGPLGELVPSAPAVVDAGKWIDGFQFALVGSDLRRHQRDPTQRRRRTSARVAPLMPRFDFTDEQREFQAAVRDLLANECTPALVRAMWTDETGRSPKLWSALADMGVIGVTAPEAAGGLGLGERDLVLLLEESGRVALPAPLVEHTAVAVPLVGEAGGEVAASWLPRLATGESIATVGLAHSPFTADAHVADLLLLQHGAELHAVERAGVELRAQPSVDGGRRLFVVEWTPNPTTQIADGRAIATAFDRGALATAAQLIGLGQHILDTSVAYAGMRHQFGKPIGTFQAVKHHLANVALALAFARPLVHRAAGSLADGDGRASTHVSMAKAAASDAANLSARVGLQVHGAIGYAFEYDLQLWMKRVWTLAASWGDAAWHRRRAGSAILG